MKAQEEERRRLARELHDDFGQATAIIELELARTAEMVSAENIELRQSLQHVREHIANLSNRLREASHRLHPSILVDLGLASALEGLVEDFRKSGSEVSARVPASSPEISLEAATALYRIAQEALRNATKHAPGAPVHLTLASSGSGMQLIIRDAGPGFDLNHVRTRAGLGLLSMQERARLAGGTLLISTRAGEGTVLTVRLPQAVKTAS
jgi:two-component system CheB/CheR fusion protein